MISGATEEELIVANARAEVLTKCGKDILDILDNQNEKYEKQLEHEVKYQNSEVVRLNKECDTYMKIATKRGNIITELEKYLYERRLTDIDGKTMVNRLLDKLKELKGDNNE